jgi:hypothetical protein
MTVTTEPVEVLRPRDAATVALEIAVKYLKGGPGVRLAADIRDAIVADRRALPQGEPVWQDWKTAPTDGSVILAYRPDAGVFQAHYVSPADIFRGHPDHESDDTEPQWWTTDGDDLESDLPTHWCSLPTPPVSVKEEGR